MMDWADRVAKWVPPDRSVRFVAVDTHTEGEPLRVILSGFPELSGETMLDLRRQASEHHDGLRGALMLEPRGHADMYGCIVVPPVSRNADAGVLFAHNEGFSTMCGHGVIGVATVLVEFGLIQPHEPETLVALDTPAGLVRAHVRFSGGEVSGVSFVSVPSFAAGLDLEVEVPGVGRIRYDLAYGGAFYAYVAAKDFELELVPAERAALVELGRAIKAAVQSAAPPTHPDHDDLGFLYGTIFVGPSRDQVAHSRNVCVFADGQIDRSPTGTGLSGRLAIQHARGELGDFEPMTVEGILGTTFTGRIVAPWQVGELPAVIPEVAGRAYVTGRNELFVDPQDPLREGFMIE